VSAASLAAGAGARIHAYPNPATDAVQFVVHVESASGGRVRLRLFDLAGRVVSDIADGLFPQGDSVISWPRTTRNGERVAPGFYESVGTVGEAMVRERIVLLP
jgi:flagellar hook assembly protein FlgD